MRTQWATSSWYQGRPAGPPHPASLREKVNQRTSATIAQIEQSLRQCHQQLQGLEGGLQAQGLSAEDQSSLDNNCKQPHEEFYVQSTPAKWKTAHPATCPPSSDHVPLQTHFPACQQQRSWRASVGPSHEHCWGRR